MRDEVIGLENEADPLVAVGIPILIFESFGRFAIDQQIAARVVVQTADDVKQCGLATARRTQNRDKAMIGERQGQIFDRGDGFFIDVIVFVDILQL